MKDLPGLVPVNWRETPYLWAPVAWLAGIAWPPVILTLFFFPVQAIAFPPQAGTAGLDMDWRILSMIVAALAIPVGLEAVRRERAATGMPSTRLGIIWRFVFYGVILAAALQILVTVLLLIAGWMRVSGAPQALGVAETNFLIYGVGLLPLTAIIGASYAAWAGLMAGLIAFVPMPPPLRTPAHILGLDDSPPAVE